MIDAWSGPTPTPQQFPKNEPNGIRALLDRINAIGLQVKEATSNLLGTAGIRLTQLGMFIDSSLTVGGSLATTGATTIGGTLGVTGPTTLGAPTTVSGSLGVSGPMTVSGTLSLPAGIIGNDALTSPLKVDSASASVTNFATTASDVNVVTASIAIPAGFTQALVYASAIAGVYNGGAVYEYLYLSVLIAGVASSRDNTDGAAVGYYASTNTAKATHLTGLSGGSISLAGSLRTDSAVAANATNRAYLEAIAIFLR